MKKFIKGRWFPLVAALVCGAGLMGVLFWQGFRITYSPELETSWDAISACAAWASVGTSFIAIWFAIQVPKKIADEQNNIALFEKRFEVYYEFERLRTFAYLIEKAISKGSDNFNLLASIHAAYAIHLQNQEDVYPFLHSIAIPIRQIPLLFPKIKHEDHEKLKQSLITLLGDNVFKKHQNTVELKKCISIIFDFSEKYDEVFKEYLSTETSRK